MSWLPLKGEARLRTPRSHQPSMAWWRNSSKCWETGRRVCIHIWKFLKISKWMVYWYKCFVLDDSGRSLILRNTVIHAEDGLFMVAFPKLMRYWPRPAQVPMKRIQSLLSSVLRSVGFSNWARKLNICLYSCSWPTMLCHEFGLVGSNAIMISNMWINGRTWISNNFDRVISAGCEVGYMLCLTLWYRNMVNN